MGGAEYARPRLRTCDELSFAQTELVVTPVATDTDPSVMVELSKRLEQDTGVKVAAHLVTKRAVPNAPPFCHASSRLGCIFSVRARIQGAQLI
jgi:hypothetical protein